VASDSAFHYYLTQPTGPAIIAFALALSFLVWRRSLGKASIAPLGYSPLAAGFAAAAVGLVWRWPNRPSNWLSLTGPATHQTSDASLRTEYRDSNNPTSSAREA